MSPPATAKTAKSPPQISTTCAPHRGCHARCFSQFGLRVELVDGLRPSTGCDLLDVQPIVIDQHLQAGIDGFPVGQLRPGWAPYVARAEFLLQGAGADLVE